MNVPEEIAGRFVRNEKLVERPSCLVFSGIDKDLGDRPVAIKLYVDQPHGNEAFIKSFDDEISILRSASHPALVPIIAGGVADGYFYIAMELIEGPSLRECIKERGEPFSVEDAVHVVTELAEGLGEVHEKGFVHGHVDSRGILFKGDDARLAGYYPPTIEKILKSTTSQGRLIVDAHYIAPEQVQGSAEIDGRADIYALSIVLYEMLTGERPFESKNPLELAMKRLAAAPPSPTKINPNIPTLLEAAILKGLAREPESRFSTVDEFVDAINGGRSKVKNPLAEISDEAGGGRLDTGTETIAVSMSTDAIKGMLAAHGSAGAPSASGGSNGDVGGTLGTSTEVGGQMDVAATAMGMSPSGLMPATMVVVDGSLVGQKFVLDKPQAMLGGDASCDIVLGGKGVPRRLGIISKKEEDYYFEPLAVDEFEINGEEIDSEDDRKLARGDILKIGEHKLRYVAPGEVFTLDENAVDLASRRGNPKLQRRILIGALVTIAACFAVAWVYKDSSDAARLAKKAAAAHKATKREKVITELRERGDSYIKDGALIAPLGANAKETFRSILELDPTNLYAKRRLKEIDERSVELEELERRRSQQSGKIERLMRDADRYFVAKNFISPPGKNARELYREVLQIDSRNTEAKERIDEINELMGDMLRRVEILYAKAEVYRDLGQYVIPDGENAYDILRQILAIDPGNDGARETLIEMAASSIFRGDQAKKTMNAKLMRKEYVTAQALGVDPRFIQPRLKGIDLMKKSRARVVIVDRKEDGKGKASEADDDRYLSTNEIKRRLAALELNSSGGGAGEGLFIDMKN